jgi:hypothetical protein
MLEWSDEIKRDGWFMQHADRVQNAYAGGKKPQRECKKFI